MNLSQARILHIELGGRRLGGSMQAFYLLREMSRAGYHTALVCAQGSPLDRMCEADGLGRFPVRFHGDTDLSLIFKLRAIYHDFRPDLIHIHSRKGADTLGALAARLFSDATVIIARRVDDPLKRGLFNRLRFGWLCDHVVAVSRGIVAELVKGGVDKAKISQVYSAIQATDYQVVADPSGVREELGIPAGARVVAVIAQLIRRKGHRFLFQAAPAILAAHPHTCFLVLGEGELQADLEQQVVGLGIAGNVVFAGYRNDIGRLFNAIDLLVHPATREGFANVAMQAMAAGVPVVSSDVGGMSESVRDGVSGLLVPPGDAAALAAAVNRLLADEGLCRELGHNGRHIVEREFTVEAMVKGNLKVYDKLLA